MLKQIRQVVITIAIFIVAVVIFPPEAQAEENRALNQCLCYESCWEAGWNCSTVSCTYAPEPSNSSPSCSDMSNGVCKCEGFGCGRTPMITTGEIYEKCYAKHGPAKAGDGNCETNKGENCQNAGNDCACSDSSVCDPTMSDADSQGCYEVPEDLCPEGTTLSTTTGECECPNEDEKITENGCVKDCPKGSVYSEAEQKCLCQRIGYIIDQESNSCIPGPDCPVNSTTNEEGRCICDSGYKPNSEQTYCVRDLSDAARFSLIMDKYYKTIPSGITNSGTKNNALSFFNSKYDEFACGGYQSKVLRFLDSLRFSTDPEERAWMENFDYGPIQSYYGGHQAVVIYPSGTNWIDDGIVLDPWPNQKPESVTIAEWAQRFSLGSYHGLAGASVYTDKPAYPTVGGSYKNPKKLKISSAEQRAIYQKLTDSQQKKLKSISPESREEFFRRALQKNENPIKVYVNSPVAAYVTDGNKKLGDAASGKTYGQLNNVTASKIKLKKGTYASHFYMPDGSYELSLEGTGSGEVRVLMGVLQEDGSYKTKATAFNVKKGQKLDITIDPDNDDFSYTSPIGELGMLIDLDNSNEMNDYLGELPAVDYEQSIEDFEAWAESNWQDSMQQNCGEFKEFKNGSCQCIRGYAMAEDGSCYESAVIDLGGFEGGGAGFIWYLLGCGCCIFMLVVTGVVVFLIVRKKKKEK